MTHSLRNPYTGEVAEKISNLFPNPCNHNFYYRIDKGRWAWINQKGYVHMLQVHKICGIVSYIEFVLKNDNRLHDVGGHFQIFADEQAAIDNIEKGENYAGEL
jgi:hypothetical protein